MKRIFFLLLCAASAYANGMIVHNEIARRAAHWFDNPYYKDAIEHAPGWFQAGAFQPDWGFACGGFVNESEFSHYPVYLHSVATVLRSYPKPWTRTTKDKIAFLLGVVAHIVADTSSHSIGLSEGLIQALRYTEFGADRNDAHHMSDVGGEFVLAHSADLDYIEDRWFVPADDLVAVYQMNGWTKVTKGDLERCMRVGFAGAIATKIFGELLFPFVQGSPGIVDLLESYPIGGITDAATWTAICWADVIRWLERPEEPTRPMCKLLENLWWPNLIPTTRPAFADAEQYLADRGITIRSTMADGILTLEAVGLPVAVVATGAPYSQLGFAIAAGDFGLAVAAPFHGRAGEAQRGAVFVGDQIFRGPDPYGRFGYALAVVDLNSDGWDDLAVSAPTTGMEELYYDGRVYVYFGSRSGLAQDLILTVTQAVAEPPQPQDRDWNWQFEYTLLGSTLAAGDLDGDGFQDLIVGSPFAAPVQSGLVLVFLSSSAHRGKIDAVRSADLVLRGEQSYGWFGQAIAWAPPFLLIGAPTTGSESAPARGRVYGYNGSELVFTISGIVDRTKFGSAMAWLGDSVVAIASPTEDNGEAWQAGAVRRIDLAGLRGNCTIDQIRILEIRRGEQAAGRFGETLLVNGTDLWIGEPLFGSFRDGLERGRVHGPNGSTFEGSTPKERFGSSLAFLGPSLAIGSPHSHTHGRFSGAYKVS